MDGIIVSTATQILTQILGIIMTNLCALLIEGYGRVKRVHAKIMFLKAELKAINAFLLKMSHVEELDERDKYWMKEIQKLSHDVHNGIKDFVLLGDDKTANPKGFKGFIIRTRNLLKHIETCHKMQSEVNNLQDLVIELGQQYGSRYKVDYNISKGTNSFWFDLFWSCSTRFEPIYVFPLASLLYHEYKHFKSAGEKIVFLKTELETVNTFLLKMTRLEGPDEQDNYWMKEMQKLSHDIHNSINDLMLLADDNPVKTKGFTGFISRTRNLLKHIKTHYGILKVDNLQAQVIEAWQRHARYKVDYNISKANNSRSMEHDVLEHILDGTKEPTNLPFELLKSITRNFSEDREIGRGGFGIVYKPSVEGEFRQHDGVVTMMMFYRRRASPKHRYDIIEV
uniref:Disease resistance N-terminal domain-containing protein n=1 Tax=Aegilops tauschii TaxID=37682 RepID=M8C416_AEGTA